MHVMLIKHSILHNYMCLGSQTELVRTRLGPFPCGCICRLGKLHLSTAATCVPRHPPRGEALGYLLLLCTVINNVQAEQKRVDYYRSHTLSSQEATKSINRILRLRTKIK